MHIKNNLFFFFFLFSQYLSKCVVGASLEEAEEEEDNASVTSSVLDAPKEGCYEVVGTLKDREKPKPDFVKELILVIDQFLKEYVGNSSGQWRNL